jgi:hypothetical protein
MKIYTVKEFNAMHHGTILVFTLGNGGMYEQYRKKGYVVSGGNCHKFFMSLKQAKAYKIAKENYNQYYKGSGVNGNTITI